MGTTDLESFARTLAGNWREFDSFSWSRRDELDRPDDWGVVYTSNRDSGLLDQSNAAAIEKLLEPFTEGDDPDIVFESHDHWFCGRVDGFSIRVYRDREITEACRAYWEIAQRLEYYPILDEEDYSRRKYEATLENIRGERPRDLDTDLPDGWERQVYTWLADNDDSAIANQDDRGGYPSKYQIRKALKKLGLVESDEPTGPEEGDLVTSDYIHFWGQGMRRKGPAVSVPADGDWRIAVREYMDREQYWPNVWYISTATFSVWRIHVH